MRSSLRAVFQLATAASLVIACAEFRGEVKLGSKDPSKNPIKAQFKDDCDVFCQTGGLDPQDFDFMDPTSDNEWILPCNNQSVIVTITVTNEGDRYLDYRRHDPVNHKGNGEEGQFGFTLKNLSMSQDGNPTYERNSYCVVQDGFLVPGPDVPFTAFNLQECHN